MEHLKELEEKWQNFSVSELIDSVNTNETIDGALKRKQEQLAEQES